MNANSDLRPSACSTINDSACFNPSHRCPDCGAHVVPTYNAARELVDHDCPSPSSNY